MDHRPFLRLHQQVEVAEAVLEIVLQALMQELAAQVVLAVVAVGQLQAKLLVPPVLQLLLPQFPEKPLQRKEVMAVRALTPLILAVLVVAALMVREDQEVEVVELAALVSKDRLLHLRLAAQAQEGLLLQVILGAVAVVAVMVLLVV
jgi:hypothetical protein